MKREYEVVQEHTITVVQRRSVVADSFLSAKRLATIQWEEYPDEQASADATCHKTRGLIKTRVRRID